MSDLLDVDAISFDLFDTLIDSRVDRLPLIELDGEKLPSTLETLRGVIAREREIGLRELVDCLRGLDLRLREEYQGTGRELPSVIRFSALAEALGFSGANAKALGQALTEAHMEVLRAHTETPPHHAPLLESLSERRRLALCSNFTHAETALRLLDETGMRASLDVVVISETNGWRKPRPDIFRAVVGELGLPAERVLHIGDRLVADVLGASRIGMRTGWLERRVADPAEALRRYDGPPPDLRLRDLSELPQRLAP